MLDWIIVACNLPAFFAVFWGLSLAGGWRRLAADYAAHEKPPGDFRRFQAVRLRWVGYNGCLTIGVCREGLYLAVWPIFRFCHPPLLIPWADLGEIQRRRTFLWTHVRAGVRRPPIVTIDLPVWSFDAAVEAGYVGLDAQPQGGRTGV